MINYIGDISKQDALVLKELAEKSESILEFGVGASTQVLAKYQKEGTMISLETELTWIERTKQIFDLLEIEKNVLAISYYKFSFNKEFDFIFNDGVLSLRKMFAFDAWKYLKIGGILAFHDTRTTEMVQILSDFIEHHSPEIESVFINVNHSNITVIKKKVAEFYCDWNLDEKREPWESGYADVDVEKLKLKMQQ